MRLTKLGSWGDKQAHMLHQKTWECQVYRREREGKLHHMWRGEHSEISGRIYKRKERSGKEKIWSKTTVYSCKYRTRE